MTVPSTAYAQDAVYLKKDQAAPFDGFLITQGQANQIKTLSIENSNLKAINSSLDISIKLQEDIISRQNNKINLLLEQNDNLAKRLAGERQMTGTERLLWLGAGIVITGIAVYGLKKATE